MLLPNCFVFISFLCYTSNYLLVSVSMEPHTWSAIQKPIIVQTIAVTAPTTNESMHIFKSFLYLLFNLLSSPCITVPALGNHPSRQRPIDSTAYLHRLNSLSTSAHSREKSLLCQGGKLPCYSDALQGPRSLMVKNVG